MKTITVEECEETAPITDKKQEDHVPKPTESIGNNAFTNVKVN